MLQQAVSKVVCRVITLIYKPFFMGRAEKTEHYHTQLKSNLCKDHILLIEQSRSKSQTVALCKCTFPFFIPSRLCGRGSEQKKHHNGAGKTTAAVAAVGLHYSTQGLGCSDDDKFIRQVETEMAGRAITLYRPVLSQR